MALRHGKEIRNSQSVVIFGYDFPVDVAERTTFGFGHAFTLRQCGRSLHRQIQNRRRNYAQERAVAQMNPDGTRINNPLSASNWQKIQSNFSTLLLLCYNETNCEE